MPERRDSSLASDPRLEYGVCLDASSKEVGLVIGYVVAAVLVVLVVVLLVVNSNQKKKQK